MFYSYSTSTIEGRADHKNLANRGAGPNLLDLEFIKGFITKQNKKRAKDEEGGHGLKVNVVLAYTTFLAMHGISWSPPRYKNLKASLSFL
jgi:hypothetical protein